MNLLELLILLKIFGLGATFGAFLMWLAFVLFRNGDTTCQCDQCQPDNDEI
jgi:hypothetical protein